MLALAATAFALNLNTNVLGALLPFVRAELGIDGDGGALLVAAAGFGSAAGALLVGPLSARWGRRRALEAGLVVFVASSAGHVVAASFWPFLALRTLSGLAVGLAYAAASACAADLAPYARRGAVMGRFNAGLFLAIPVGLPLTVLLAVAGHWTWIFAVQALVGLGAGLATRRFVPGDGTAGPAAGLSPLRNAGVVPGLVATMLHVGSFFTVVQLATAWLDDTGLVAKERQMWVWVGLGALSVAGSAGFARLSDRVGKRLFVLATSAVLVGCFLLLARGPSPGVLLVVACVLALAAAARTGPLQALLSGLVPAGRLGALLGLRGFRVQRGVGTFALGAGALPAELGFEGVLVLAAGCQFLSYLAIRLGVHEPADKP